MHINNQTIFQRFVLHSAALAQAFRDRVSGVTGEMVPNVWTSGDKIYFVPPKYFVIKIM